MAWIFNTTGTGSGSGSTTVTVTATGVKAGDLVVVPVKWEGGDTTVTCSDGASNLTETTAVHRTDGGGGSMTCFYLLASTKSGSVTYTATFGASRTFQDIGVMTYSPTRRGAVLDGTPSSAAGSSATLNSGNITTSGTDGVAFGYYGETGNTPSAQKINNVAADQVLSFGTAPRSSLWSKAYSAGFTGAATATISPSGVWNGGIIAFNLTPLALQTFHNNLRPRAFAPGLAR